MPTWATPAAGRSGTTVPTATTASSGSAAPAAAAWPLASTSPATAWAPATGRKSRGRRTCRKGGPGFRARLVVHARPVRLGGVDGGAIRARTREAAGGFRPGRARLADIENMASTNPGDYDPPVRFRIL